MQYILVESDEFENLYPLLYNIFLNPDYVAARSLRSLRSNNLDDNILHTVKYGLARVFNLAEPRGPLS